MQAALQLLASQGFTRMTLDQVAAAAGVSKSTIHLRWRTKADLVTAALESLRQTAPRVLTGDTRTDLVGLLHDFAAVLARVHGMPMIGTCLSEEAHTPELLQLLRARTVLPRRELLLEVLAAATSVASCARGWTPRWWSPRCSARSTPTTSPAGSPSTSRGPRGGPRPPSTWSSPEPRV